MKNARNALAAPAVARNVPGIRYAIAGDVITARGAIKQAIIGQYDDGKGNALWFQTQRGDVQDEIGHSGAVGTEIPFTIAVCIYDLSGMILVNADSDDQLIPNCNPNNTKVETRQQAIVAEPGFAKSLPPRYDLVVQFHKAVRDALTAAYSQENAALVGSTRGMSNLNVPNSLPPGIGDSQ